MSYLIRSWNVFHGRTHPPGRHAYLKEAVQLAIEDGPDVLCLQEVPVWGLEELAGWSGMSVVGHATRPGFGPLRLPAVLSRRLTDLHHGFIRSALAGQANAVLVSSRLELGGCRLLVLNGRSFRKEQARRLHLDTWTRIAWARERRLCQAVRAALPEGRRVLILNVHASHLGKDRRIADAELSKAANFAEKLAKPGEIVFLAGDFNVRSTSSRTLAELTGSGAFSAPGPGIDHILVRGAEASKLRVWPEARRRLDGTLLSDHAPVELVAAIR